MSSILAVSVPASSVLTDGLIARRGERAATYDRDSRFVDEDFAEVNEAGSLKMPIPPEMPRCGDASAVAAPYA